MEENQVEGFRLSGEEVQQMEQKTFKIYAEPFYAEFDDFNDASKKKRKIVVPVELANNNKVEWIANKTSQKQIIAKKGRVLKDWIGFTGEFVTKMQVVGKDEKPVIYLK